MKLKAEHKRFIYKMLGRGIKEYRIYKMLIDQKVADEYSFEPIMIAPMTVYTFVKSKRFDKSQVDKAREEWFATFDDVYLYHKKNRILELQRIMFDSSASNTDKINAMRAIKAEIGEDVDKMAEALKGSGTTNIIAVGNLDDSQQSTVRDNLKVAFRF